MPVMRTVLPLLGGIAMTDVESERRSKSGIANMRMGFSKSRAEVKKLMAGSRTKQMTKRKEREHLCTTNNVEVHQ